MRYTLFPLFALLLWVSFFLFVPGALAAEMYFGSIDHALGVNGLFEAKLFLNTNNESINAIAGKIVFPEDAVVLNAIRNADSIITLWIEQPTLKTNEITFSGVVPGGYRENQGKLFSLLFQTKKEGEGELQIKDAKTFLNDGKGTEATVIPRPFMFLTSRNASPVSASAYDIRDTDPPEPFTPEIYRSQDIFDGEYFLIFATQDKESGIDHYEVKEGGRSFVAAESPYLLQNQKLNQKIFVKVVDKNGNERIAVVEPRYPVKWYQRLLIWIIIAIVGIVTYLAWRKFKNR